MGCFLTALIFMGPRQETSGMNGIVDQKTPRKHPKLEHS